VTDIYLYIYTLMAYLATQDTSVNSPFTCQLNIINYNIKAQITNLLNFQAKFHEHFHLNNIYRLKYNKYILTCYKSSHFECL